MSDSERDDDQQAPQSEVEIIRDIEDKCYKAFMDFDKESNGGQIKSDQVVAVLEHMNIKMSEQEMYKIIAEIDPENTGYLQYSAFKAKIADREVQRLMGSDESELLDAFVAMGGEQNGEGCVDAKKLIKTIKEEFQMTIDIEKLINEIDEDGSGEIEFDEFKALLQSDF